MSQVTYDRAVRTLFDAAPEFVSSSLLCLDDPPYVVYGAFALYLSDLARRASPESDAKVRQAFDLINSISESDDDEVQNLVYVGILEMLTDTAEAVAAARILLAPRPRAWFEEVLRGWRGPGGA